MPQPPQPPAARSSRRALLWFLLACAVLYGSLFNFGVFGPRPSTPPPAPPELLTDTVTPDAGAPPIIKPPPRAAAPKRRCEPHASKACFGGDVWWLDSCAAPGAIAQACDGRACNGDHCADANDNQCDDVTSFGRCDGELAKVCIDNKIVSVDCKQQGQRCVMTREGVSCKASDPRSDCRPTDPASCIDNKVVQCVDGSWQSVDCSARRATCTPTEQGPRCLTTQAFLPRLTKLETCNGRDDDDDGKIDEDSSCDPIALVAFIPSGAELPNLAFRMQRDLALLNRLMYPLTFVWQKQIEVSPELRQLEPQQLQAVAKQLSQSESAVFIAHQLAVDPSASRQIDSGLPFYIPVLFTEDIDERPPHGGVSTLPNSRCGGVRISDQPAPTYGIVVLANGRRPETLAHELGHYLGLCHTHDDVSSYQSVNSESASELPVCNVTGDGICDTARDPGPDRCETEPDCSLICATSDTPDPNNVMSYYIPCRKVFTEQQLAEVQRNLALRRAWFRCLDSSDCPCQPGLSSGDGACPAEMSCQPTDRRGMHWQCVLDGPALPGAPCRGLGQCSLDSFCLARADAPSGQGQGQSDARCVRPCTGDSLHDGCDCADFGLPVHVCQADLAPR